MAQLTDCGQLLAGDGQLRHKLMLGNGSANFANAMHVSAK
jgi:hypothetical protein